MILLRVDLYGRLLQVPKCVDALTGGVDVNCLSAGWDPPAPAEQPKPATGRRKSLPQPGQPGRRKSLPSAPGAKLMPVVPLASTTGRKIPPVPPVLPIWHCEAGLRPLVAAVRSRQSVVAEYLLLNNADVNGTDLSAGRSALHYAAAIGDTHSTLILLRRKARSLSRLTELLEV